MWCGKSSHLFWSRKENGTNGSQRVVPLPKVKLAWIADGWELSAIDLWEVESTSRLSVEFDLVDSGGILGFQDHDGRGRIKMACFRPMTITHGHTFYVSPKITY